MADRKSSDVEPTSSEVRELLEARDWEGLTEALGFDYVGTSVPAEALDAWGVSPESADRAEALRVLAAGDGYRVMLATGVDNYSELRRAIVRAHRANPAECVIWWLVGEATATVAAAATGEEGEPFVRRMEVDLEDPDPVAARQWAQLAVGEPADEDLADPGRAYARRAHDVLRQEEVTREFFDGFREALERLTDEIEQGPDEEQARHDVALATLLRLVFLYFLQERGALDGDRRFVVRHFRSAVAAGESFYRTTLRPLFFGALNRTPGERSDRARQLGRLPFLNGGLFEPLPAERRHPEMNWSNDCWSQVIEELLERFQFAVDEGIGPDENRAVDPEMLGKVFEGLMYGERRHDSGSFYTPRDVVRRVVSEAISSHAAEEAGVSRELVREVVAGERRSLGAEPSRRLRETLESFHLLDPAVGTGAFFLEAMRALERLYAACDGEAPGDYERRREIVHDHLFGVDVQKTAVRICELRIWLALLSSMPEDWSIQEIPALPNLSHRIACGNSLMAPEDRVRLGAGVGPAAEGAFASYRAVREDHREEMAGLEESFYGAHGERKVELRRQMERLERTLQRDLLQARVSVLDEKREPYEKLEASEDLFGEPVDLEESQRREKEEIEAELGALREALEDLEADRAEFGGFSFAARYGAAVGDAGFDVVVTNPPWVRANRLERSRRKRLEQRYRSFSNDLWSGADAMGISVPFGAQVDLAALFTERCLELLRPGGHLGALLPSKLFRSLHGSGLRGLLGEHRIDAICDYSDGERTMFDATVYPAVLQMKKEEGDRNVRRRGRTGRRPRGSQDAPLEMTIWRDEDRRTWSTSPQTLPALGEDLREPWLFVPPEIREIFEEMWERSTPLGSVPPLQPKRGLMTGCNRVFVRDPSEVREWLGEAADAWTRPVLSGRDIRAREVEPSGRLLWAYDEHLEPREELPGPLREYFEERAEALRDRADYDPGGPLWQLFRLKEGLVEPKVVWRDLAPRLEAATAPGNVIPLNTVYFIPTASMRAARATAGLFNSEPLRGYAYALGERARGGWRRHFCWVMRMLPIPDSFVDEVLGGEPSDAPGMESGEAFGGWVRRQYGLDAGAVRRLREWRAMEQRDEPSREAA